MKNLLKKIMHNNSIEFYGTCSFSKLKENLIFCRNLNKLPANAKTVVCMLFPYKVEVKERNISRYAIVNDYHTVVNNMLKKISQELKNHYSKYQFVYFCDNSPINEKKAAKLCGLGTIGDNGLIINKKYGSWVFIGEIVTDLDIAIENPVTDIECFHCGICKKKCATGILKDSHFKKENCLSFITQKKAELTLKEKKIIQKSKSVWGCDICQEYCPLNKDVPITPIKEFKENAVSIITNENYNKILNRAYSFRPLYVIKRNMRILNTDFDNNNP